MKTDVYALGSALMDIQVYVKDEIFDELGIEKGSMHLTDHDHQEEIIKKLLGDNLSDLEKASNKLHTAAGGSAANTVYGLSQLGGAAALCGKVAKDGFGDLYIQQMKDSGVLFNEKQVEYGMTGTCIVLISPDAQRTMLTCLGVSSEISYDDIDEELLKGSKYVYLEGYLFDSELATETIMKVVDTAKRNNIKIALTASDPFCIERHKDIFLSLLSDNVNLLFANAVEAKALTETESTGGAIKALYGLCKNIAVTDGEHGSTLSFDGEAVKINPLMVTTLDTTGAGDSYAAGLLYGITHGYPLEASGKIASFYASRIVSQIGPRYTGNIKVELKSLKL